MQIDSNKIIDSIKAEIGVEPQFTKIPDILKEGSYLFYELEDKEIEYPFDSENSEYNTYTKKISPLFLSHVIDAKSNSLLLDIMDEEVPFYHLESSKENMPDTINISSARDCGINDVPSPLQESKFYEVWFRESQGAIQNYLLLDVYNKLRWPIINENQYLNASLFPELAQELYNKSSDKESLIEFRNSALENKQDNEFLDEDGSSNKIGCIDYLNDIINQKLTSMYALVDYNPNQSNLLSDWAESVAQSGQMLEEDIETQLSVYRLQDIKYELLRRKFAGSRTLYSLALASIDRQGSFISTIPAGALTTDNTLFKDKRLIRLINLPGILSEFNAEASVKPITTFYTDKDEDSAIPLSTLVPLYYTSSFGPYDAESFYTKDEKANSIYLRDNIHKLEWDNLSGLLSGSSAKRIYPTLDEKIVSQQVESGFRYRTLDDKIEENGEEVTIYLDRRRSILSSSSTFGNMFDLSANRLLYNSNTLQQLLKDDYPYLTYPIADGNSISMMDLPWINYIKTSTENKSRVQDRVDFGAQINKYQEITNNQLGEYNFFAISYGSRIKDDDGALYKASNLPKLSYDEACLENEAITITDPNDFSITSKKPRFAYLWYCTLKYKTEDFKFSDSDLSDLEKPITTTLISRITLIDSTNTGFEDIEAFKELKHYNEGLLPLTYPNLKDDAVLNMRLGVYENSFYDHRRSFYDDLTKNGYTKAQFIFATSDLVGLTEDLHKDPREDNITAPYLSANPSADTKALFYAVKKSIDDKGNYNYRWSEPIKVIEITDELINNIEKETAKNKNSIVTVKPDWYHMMYQLNPYLNFTSKSASTLRHRDVLAAASYKESKGIDQNIEIVIQGPSENTALSNLARSRGMAYTCNDNGSSTSGKWVDPNASTAALTTFGIYLNRTKASSNNFKPEGNDAEYVSIFGDNREKDLFDSSDGDTQDKRSAIRYNSLTHYPCLEFKLGAAATSTSTTPSSFSPNYLRLQPCKDPSPKNYSQWAWNEHNDGIALCVDISFPVGDYQSPEDNEVIKYLKNKGSMTLLSRVGKPLDDKNSLTKKDFCSEFDLSLEYKEANKIVVVFKYYPYGLNIEDDKEYIWKLQSKPLIVKDTSNIRIAASVQFSDTISTFEDVRNVIMSLVVNNENEEVTHTYYNKLKLENEGSEPLTYIKTIKDIAKGLNIREDELREVLIDRFGSSSIVNSKVNTADAEKEAFIPGAPCKGNNYIEVMGKTTINEENKVIRQDNCFFGSLYDLRLYNTGATGIGLRLLCAGSTRELFSYSPSNYILGYNLYRDLGIFKEVSLRKVSNKLNDVHSIRIFNRSVWDSILTDMYPVSYEEQTNVMPQFTQNYWDPKTDTDIWGIVNGNLTLKDCIEQVLEETAEVNNNQKLFNNATNNEVIISYNNKEVKLINSDILTLINTSIYPVVYNKDSLTTVAVRFGLEGNVASTLEDNPIKLPNAINPVDGVLEYDADINLNYTISPKSNFTNWLSNGTHITLSYNSALQKIMAIYSSTDLAGNVSQADNSQTNHILVPLTVPKQTDLNWDNIGYFDRINLKGIQLNNDLVTLLRATSYYNELRIPVAIDLVEKNALGILNNRFTTYASKWDAIRTLKEGTYYITCKYPFQILPFEDHLYDTNNEAKYASLYATVRFKIEVRGIPMIYEEGKRGANSISSAYEEKYSSSRLNDTLRSGSSLLNPEDNRSFPHRAINIDLYVQDIESEAGRMYYNSTTSKAQEAYKFKWRLIGTNHSNDYPASKNYLELNRDRLNSGLVLETDIPLFFSKSYNTSFFIAKTEKTTSGTTYNSESADDDLIRPIKLNPRYGAVKVSTYIKCANSETAVDGITYYDENNAVIDPQPAEGSEVGKYYTRVENLDKLEAYKESDLDNLVLAAGRSYKILWDYTGKVSEFSFTDNIYSLSNEAQQNLSSSEDISYYMTDSEKVNYARLSSLLDTSNTTDYLYDRDGLSYDHNAVELVGTCGYNVVNSEFKKVSLETVDSLEKIEKQAIEGGERAYKSYQALEASNIPDNDDPSIITYIYDEESQTYTYYRYDEDTNKQVLISPSDLDLTKLDAWKFGEYYVYKSIPTVIYKAVVGLTSKVFKFKYDSQYYKWVDDHYEALTLELKDSVDSLPTIIGNENILYQVGEDYYGCFENQQPFFSDKSTVRNSGVFNFGNPYSRSSSHNFLLSIKNDNLNDSRANINNSYYFAYTPTEVPDNISLSAEPITKTIQAYKSKYKDIAYVQLDEANVIKTHYDRISSNVLKAIASLSSKSSGVITALSEFMPRYTYLSASTRAAAENSYVRSVTDSMHAYYSAKRKVPSKNSNITITRKGLYSNNLFASQSFDNEKYWSWENYNEAYNNTYISGYVSDDDWDEGLGKDVYKIEYKRVNDDIGDNSNYPLVLRYKAGSVVKAASYETALNIKVAGTGPDRIYLGDDVKTDELVYLEDPEDRPYTGDPSKIYLCKSTVQAWYYNAEGWQDYPPIQKYDSSKTSEDLDKNTIYIDSITNSIDVYIIYLSGGVEIEKEKLNVTGISQTVMNLDTPVTFADTWYNIASKSSKIIKADTIEFAFCCKEALTFYITKAVARTSNSWSHLLGLSDGLYSNSTSDSESYVELESHRSVVFKNAKTKELLPIQFNAYTNVRNPLFTSLGAKIMYPISGLTKAKDFISSCSLGFPKSTSKLETLYDPNVRRMHYKRQLKSNIVQGYYNKEVDKFYEVFEDENYYKLIKPNAKNLYLDLIGNKYYEYKDSKYAEVDETLQSTIPFEETVTFSKYTTAIDDFGIASRKESSSTTKDLYTSADVKYVFKGAQDKSLVVNSLVINNSQSSPLYNYSTNLELTSEILIDRDGYLIANGPIDLSDETISAMTNCFNPKKYRKNEDSVVAITNIQLIGKSETADQDSILYELEYLPIIYKENDQHVSYNIMLRKPSDGGGSLN